MACEPRTSTGVFEDARQLAATGMASQPRLGDVEFTASTMSFLAWYRGRQWRVLEPTGPNQIVILHGPGSGACACIVVGSVGRMRNARQLLSYIRDLIRDFDDVVHDTEECWERKTVTVSFDPRDPIGDQLRVRPEVRCMHAYRRRNRVWVRQDVPLVLPVVKPPQDTMSVVGATLRRTLLEFACGL